MSNSKNFLVELGTEELPPKALRDLSHAFQVGIQAGLAVERLNYSDIKVFATPRRLGVLVQNLNTQQADEIIERRGPPVDRAFDANGLATKAATAFAQSNGVEVDDLEQTKTVKGVYLVYRGTEPGKATVELMPAIIKEALDKLPIPKRMRWGNRTESFVRPVHWLLMLFGNDVVPCEILGLTSGRITYGHRFMAPEEISISQPSAYQNLLLHAGEVIADFSERRKLIQEQVHAKSTEVSGRAKIDNDLLNEVTALVEMPVAILGDFDKRFLKLPKEVLIATLEQHQKYFPLYDASNNLLPNFITISNIKSRRPELVKSGNERVIRPRLADAEFFYRSDLKKDLEQRIGDLDKVVFQKDLGSLGDKVARIEALAKFVASLLPKKERPSTEFVERAARLCKCDLLTDMIGEFPELQGVMGRYYALEQNENSDIALTLDEHYLPRFSGDKLPSNLLGQVLAIADKLDTIVGIFAIGKKPTGTRDPFSLRRHSIGVLRILVEAELNLDLRDLIAYSLEQMPVAFRKTTVIDEVFAYIQERARGYFLEQKFNADQIAAVFASNTASPLDMQHRLRALQKFAALPAAPNLAAANKRVSNILKKNAEALSNLPEINVAKMTEKAEYALHQALQPLHNEIEGLLNANRYTDVLLRLARLREPLDAFFDQVMVMSEVDVERENRLNLLKDFHKLSSGVADLSLLDLTSSEQASS